MKSNMRYALCMVLVLAIPACRRNAPSPQVVYEAGEFTVVFPTRIHERETFTKNLQGRIAETADDRTTHLRVELLPNEKRETILGDFRYYLEAAAREAGVEKPAFTIGDTDLGKTGTYHGIKTIGEQKFRILGKVIVGKQTVLHIFALEPSALNPTADFVNFLDSVRLKKP